GFGFADLVDRIALLLLLLTPILIRFTTRLRPLSPDQTAYYLAIWYVTLGALDKFEGYGDGERWVIPAIAAGLLVMTYLLWNMLSSRRLSTIAPVVLLLVPVSQAPLDFVRNALARRETAAVAGIYVTKITAEHIYGVYFTNPAKVRWVSRTGLERPVIHENDTTGLGSGTMSPQYSRANSWQRALVKRTFE
ncbi:MAG: hypothetical protein L6Q68_19740, partial [Aquabacterium sp.]|nr:hypothetical protein [Aquabacterium sp.]